MQELASVLRIKPWKCCSDLDWVYWEIQCCISLATLAPGLQFSLLCRISLQALWSFPHKHWSSFWYYCSPEKSMEHTASLWWSVGTTLLYIGACYCSFTSLLEFFHSLKLVKASMVPFKDVFRDNSKTQAIGGGINQISAFSFCPFFTVRHTWQIASHIPKLMVGKKITVFLVICISILKEI